MTVRCKCAEGASKKGGTLRTFAAGLIDTFFDFSFGDSIKRQYPLKYETIK